MIQNAAYLVINKDNLKSDDPDQNFKDMIQNDTNFKKDLSLKHPEILDYFNLDIKYVTSAHVEEQNKELFDKKVMYLNQLMNLKQKGKRLIMLDELDYVERQQVLDA